MPTTKLSELKVSTVFFFPDGSEEWPIFVGNFKYSGKSHPKTVVKEIMENKSLHKLFDDWEDDEECEFLVIKDSFGKGHYSKEISYDDANVKITVGELRGTTDHNKDEVQELEKQIEDLKMKMTAAKTAKIGA